MTTDQPASLPTTAAILSAIPRLPKADLRNIYARIGMLLRGDDHPGDRQDEKSVYLAWRELMRARYGTRLPEYEIARTLPMYARHKLGDGAKAVIDFIDHEVPGLRGGSREGAIMQCVACCVGSLRSDMKSGQATAISAAALRDVAACVDASFPGYAEYGMLKLVFTNSRSVS